MALNTSNLQFAEDGFLAINFSASTATQGSVILGVTDFSLSYTNDNVEVQAIEDNFNKFYVGTSSSWTMSSSYQIRNQTGSTAIDLSRFSGDTKLLSGNGKTKTGLEVLEFAKTKNLTVTVFMRLKAGNYQKGQAIITSVTVDNSVGALTSGTLELQGVGVLSKVP